MQNKSAAQKAITGYFVGICASFLLLMNAVCMILRPELFKHPHWGISFFGARLTTALPYYLGFAIIIGCLVRVAQLLRGVKGSWLPLRKIFAAVIALAVGIAITSPMSNSFVLWSHLYLCLALLLLVLGAEVWILRRPGATWLDYLGMATLIAGAVVVNLSGTWIGVLGLYAWGEILVFLGAFICLWRAALRAVPA